MSIFLPQHVKNPNTKWIINVSMGMMTSMPCLSHWVSFTDMMASILASLLHPIWSQYSLKMKRQEETTSIKKSGPVSFSFCHAFRKLLASCYFQERHLWVLVFAVPTFTPKHAWANCSRATLSKHRHPHSPGRHGSLHPTTAGVCQAQTLDCQRVAKRELQLKAPF